MQPRRTPSAYASRFLRFRLNQSGKLIKSQLASHKMMTASRRENTLLKYSLFCCTLLAAAHGVNAANAIAMNAPPECNVNPSPTSSGARPRSSSSSGNFATFMNATCSSTAFSPVNKLLRIRYDKDANGIDRPAACMNLQTQDLCRKEEAIGLKWTNDPSLPGNSTRLENQRQSANSDTHFEWRRSTIECYTIATSLNAQQAKIFNEYCQLLREIEWFHQYATQAVLTNIGNCDEHMAYNFMKLFRYSVENNQPIKLQRIFFKSLIPGQGHTFLLIDSDAPDIDISNNRDAVTNYLKQIKKGKICDSWNGLLFIPIEERNEYYCSGWESVEVKTYPTHFDLHELSGEALNYFRRELRRLGINLELRPNADEDAIEDEPVAASRTFCPV